MSEAVCEACGGLKTVPRQRPGAQGRKVVRYITCPRCGGSGKESIPDRLRGYYSPNKENDELGYGDNG